MLEAAAAETEGGGARAGAPALTAAQYAPSQPSRTKARRENVHCAESLRAELAEMAAAEGIACPQMLRGGTEHRRRSWQRFH